MTPSTSASHKVFASGLPHRGNEDIRTAVGTIQLKRFALGDFPTRVVRMPELSAELGIDLWIKHEFEADGFGAGNKVRKIEYLLPDLIWNRYSGLIVDGTTQSNCAMALALYAPRFGLSVDLVLYGPTAPAGNYVDILRSGANVTLLKEWSPAGIRSAEDRILSQARERGQRLYIVPTGATNDITAYGGIHLVEELALQEAHAGISFDYVLFPTASGGTQAGLEIGRAMLGKPWKLIGVGVANDPDFFRREVRKIASHKRYTRFIKNEIDPHTYMGALGSGYDVPLPDSFAQIKELRRKFGLVLDSVYTYKAFVGLRELIECGEIEPGSSVVFIHTGGTNERFLPE